jgi:poly-gamma-glutamate capsule biosynthesis protein CapA/YwtB (metallophosphatase superfamily)
MIRSSITCFLLVILAGCGNSPTVHSGDRVFSETESVTVTTIGQTLPALGGSMKPAVSPTRTLAPILPSPTATLANTPTSNRNVSIAFVGDIMLGRTLAGRIERGEGGMIFASVEPVLQSADLAVGNLECALGEGGMQAAKAYTFLAPPKSAALLRGAGFDLLSLANNHSLDFGPDVFRLTGALLGENEIRFVGGGANAAQAHAPVRFEIGGLRVAFLAYVDVASEYLSKFDTRSWSAGHTSPGIAWADDEEIKRDLQALNGDTDFVVVLFHYGTEAVVSPSHRQIQLSRLAVDYGADMIVGTHPHVVQGVEEYKDGLIFYSLGNFVFDGFDGSANKSAILWITISEKREITYSLMALNIVDGIPRIGE